MMAQKLMSENKDNPFNSRFFQPSDALSPPRYTGLLLPIERDMFGEKGNFEFATPRFVTDAISGINKFGQAMRGQLSPEEIQKLAFDTSMNVTGGTLLGSKLLPNAMPRNALAMGLSSGSNATDNSILQQLKTLRSDLKNASSQAEKVRIEEQITALRGQREQQLNDVRKQANIERFGYDPNDPSTLPDTSYRIQHQPRGPKDDTPVRLDDLTKSTTGESAGFPDDFYTPRGQSIYAQGPRFSDDQYGLANIESYNIIKSIRGKPDAEVTIYRGVPDEESIKSINPGDFVTLSKKYAELHAASGYGDGGQEAGKILSKKVKVKDIYWDQNDVNEFGYFPESN